MCNKKATLKFSNLVEVMMHFSDTKVCKDYLASMRWGGNIVCPHCAKNGYSIPPMPDYTEPLMLVQSEPPMPG